MLLTVLACSIQRGSPVFNMVPCPQLGLVTPVLRSSPKNKPSDFCRDGVGSHPINYFLNSFQIILILALVLFHLQFQRSLVFIIIMPEACKILLSLTYVFCFPLLTLDSAFSDLLSQLLLIYHTSYFLKFCCHVSSFSRFLRVYVLNIYLL